MSPRTVRLAIGSLAVLGLLTACSGKTGGSAETPGPGSSSAAPTDGSGAPKVPAPLPTQQLLAGPCSGMSDADAKTIGLITPGAINNSGLPGCVWHSTSFAENVVGIAPIKANKNGIGDTYSDKARYAYFEPTSIEGYPAVFGSPLGDDRAKGACTLIVGVTDQLAVSISSSIASGKNVTQPCGINLKVGTAMINHLKTAS